MIRSHAYREPQPSKLANLKREAAIKRLRRAEKDRLVGSQPVEADLLFN